MSGSRSGSLNPGATLGPSVALDQSLTKLATHDMWFARTSSARRAESALTELRAPEAHEPQHSPKGRARGGDGSRAHVKGGTAADAAAADGRSAPLPSVTRIGVIADNHGYLDPAVLEIFAGVTHIIHAGDIVEPEILAALRGLAPVTAVAGNMDSGDLSSLPREAAGEVGGVRFVVAHKRKRVLKDLAAGRIDGLPKGEAPDLVIYGHDHVPAAAWVDGTLYLDPGSASAPHEEDDGPTVAIVEVRAAGLAVSFFPLERRDSD